MSTKIFTVEQANRMLPALRKVVALLQDRVRWLESNRPEVPFLVEEFKIPLDAPVDPEYFANLLKIRRIMAEVDVMGCQIKDIQMGLVDFPAKIDGKDVLLCWRAGEESVRYYHDLTSGYSGRRPIPRAHRERKPAAGGGKRGGPQ